MKSCRLSFYFGFQVTCDKELLKPIKKKAFEKFVAQGTCTNCPVEDEMFALVAIV